MNKDVLRGLWVWGVAFGALILFEVVWTAIVLVVFKYGILSPAEARDVWVNGSGLILALVVFAAFGVWGKPEVFRG